MNLLAQTPGRLMMSYVEENFYSNSEILNGKVVMHEVAIASAAIIVD
jgi:hypothetical protein